MKYIGLDFGTSNCSISVIDDNGTINFIKYNDSYIIPTILNINNGNIRYGKYEEGVNIYNLKRLIGLKYNDITDFSLFPFEINNVNNNINIYNYKLDELITFLLSWLKILINDNVNDEWVTILTVPAYYNERQRSYLLNILKIININCTKILNEPTCACISYLNNKDITNKILVFDLGGGTLDLTLMNIENDFYEVEKIYGDNHFGGLDITNEIAINKNISYEDAEILKLIDDNIILSSILTQRIIDALDKVIDNKDDIDFVIMVGGSSKMKAIKDIVSNYINKIIDIPGIIIKDSCIDFEDIAVALGAGLYNYNINIKKEIVLLNRLPYAVGIDTNGIFTPIIPKNSLIPISITKNFTTDTDYQTSIRIDILQGNEYFSKNNLLIGTFEFTDIIPMLAKTTIIYVTIKVNMNSIIEVSAKERRGDNNKIIKINAIDIINDKYDGFNLPKNNNTNILFDRYQYLLELLNRLLDNNEKEVILQDIKLIKKYSQLFNVSLGTKLVENINLEIENNEIDSNEVDILITNINKHINILKNKFN